jgi:hypothetical protein
MILVGAPFDWDTYAGGKGPTTQKTLPTTKGPPSPRSATSPTKATVPTTTATTTAPPSPSSADYRTPKELYDEIDRVDTWLNTVANNGLFRQNTEVNYETVQDHIQKARESLSLENYFECEHSISLAYNAYSDALYSTSRLWRFSNIYAGGILIYLIGIVIAVFAFYYFGGYDRIAANLLIPVVGNENYPTAAHAVAWGILGSVLREFWYLKNEIDDRKYTNAWRFYLIFGPFLGAFFGAITYFVIVGGLLSLSGGSQTKILNPLIIIPTAFLSGYNWEWGVGLFDRIAKAFGEGTKKKSS